MLGGTASTFGPLNSPPASLTFRTAGCTVAVWRGRKPSRPYWPLLSFRSQYGAGREPHAHVAGFSRLAEDFLGACRPTD